MQDRSQFELQVKFHEDLTIYRAILQLQDYMALANGSKLIANSPKQNINSNCITENGWIVVRIWV